jgi:glutaryl-CoA dehydrogenase
MSRLLFRRLPRAGAVVPARFSMNPALHGRSYASASAVPQFNWEDPLGSRNLLTEEELAISETAERYCQEQLLPRVLRTSFVPETLEVTAAWALLD